MRLILRIMLIFAVLLVGCSQKEDVIPPPQISESEVTKASEFLFEDVSEISKIGLVVKQDIGSEQGNLYDGTFIFLNKLVEDNKELFEGIKIISLTNKPAEKEGVPEVSLLVVNEGKEYKRLSYLVGNGLLYDEDNEIYYSLSRTLIEILHNELNSDEITDNKCIVYNAVPYFAVSAAGKEMDLNDLEKIGSLNDSNYYVRKDDANYIFVQGKVTNQNGNLQYYTYSSFI